MDKQIEDLRAVGSRTRGPVRVGNAKGEVLIHEDGRIEINGSRITVNGKPMEPQEP